MPQTSYALLGAIRSHRVDSPSFDRRTRDRPNACSLCHLEKSESWAAEKTAEWFGRRPAFALSREAGLSDASTAAGAVFALAGDAAVRAITAAALGRLESGELDLPLRRQLLGELRKDDYAAVRFIAERELGRLPNERGVAPLPPERVRELLNLRDTRRVTIAE
jgi:hypothetical protein